MLIRRILEDTGYQESSLPSHGVKLELGMMDFPYYLIHVFSSHPIDEEMIFNGFRRHMDAFAFAYMEKWAMSRPKDLQKNLAGLFEFNKKFEVKKIFQQVVDGKDRLVEVYFPVGNLKLQIKRFGDCLGLKLRSNNINSNDIHEDGTKIVEELRKENHLQVDRFLQHISCTIPLKKEYRENNSHIIDLAKVFEDLGKNCQGHLWFGDEQHFSALIADYIEAGNSHGAIIGEVSYRKISLCILAKLSHSYPSDLTEDGTWREGNVSEFKKGAYRFRHGGDLCLQIKINSNLPKNSFMKDVDVNMEVHEDQVALRYTGAALYLQLCAQEMLK